MTKVGVNGLMSHRELFKLDVPHQW